MTTCLLYHCRKESSSTFYKKIYIFYNIIFKILFLQSLTFALRHDSVNTYNKFIILYPFPSLEVSMYQQQSPALKETNPHGSQAFPCAFYRLKLSGHGILVKHHWHEEVEIIYFPGGTFTLDINMETFDVSSECFYFINPGELHSIRARSKEVSMEYAVVFQPELLCSPFYDTVQTQLVQPLQNGRLIFPRCISANHPVFPIIKEQFQNITNAFYRCSFSEQLEELHDSLHINLFRASGNAIVGLADQLLIKASLLNIFADFSNRQLFSQTEKSDDHRVETIKTTITYIRDHYQEKIYIRDLASLIGLNEQYFCRFFKKAIGMSPIEYLNEYRIRQAVRLLKDSSLPVTEICLDCGYNNMGNFLREFRKYTGTTPLQYRKHSQGIENPSL